MIKNAKIEELVNCISKCNKDNYIEKITSLGLTREDFEGQIHFSNKKYTRTKVAKTDEFELILMGWAKGQKTPKHNHDGHEGFVYSIDAKIKETTFIYDKEKDDFVKTGEGVLNSNELSYAKKDVNGFHTLENISGFDALTLHLYKIPIEKCLVEVNNEIIIKKLAFDYE